MNFHSVPEATQNLHEISAGYFSEVPVAVGSGYAVEAEISLPRHGVTDVKSMLRCTKLQGSSIFE